MAPRLTVVLLLVALCTACSTSRAVRLDTGQGAPREYTPPASNTSGHVDAESFEQTLTQVMLEAPLPLRSSRQGPLVLASYPSHDMHAGWQRLMSRSFGGFCKPAQRTDDGLSVLDDVMALSPWDKLGVSLALSLDPLRASISKAVENTLAPQLFYTVIASGLVTWVVLAANPEPLFTKAAAVVSAILLVCLGVDTFLELVDASRELKRITGKATTLEELQQAAERFANHIGPEVARVFVLAVTVAVCHGMAGGSTWLASRLASLPSFSEAAAVGASRMGLQLASVGQVSAVAVSVDGALTLTLPPTAVTMVARAVSSVSDEEGPIHHIATDKWHDATHSGGPWTPRFKELFDRAGMSLDDPANKVRVRGHRGE